MIGKETQLSQVEKLMHDSFTDKDYVNQLIKRLDEEPSTGRANTGEIATARNTPMSEVNVAFFQGLFRNYGYKVFEAFKDHLKPLASSDVDKVHSHRYV